MNRDAAINLLQLLPLKTLLDRTNNLISSHDTVNLTKIERLTVHSPGDKPLICQGLGYRFRA